MKLLSYAVKKANLKYKNRKLIIDEEEEQNREKAKNKNKHGKDKLDDGAVSDSNNEWNSIIKAY